MYSVARERLARAEDQLHGAGEALRPVRLVVRRPRLDHVAEVRSVDVAEREVLAASGIDGGLVYWLFAGRKAGVWK